MTEQLLLFTVTYLFLSGIQLFVTPWSAAHQVPLSSIIFQRLLKFMSIETVMPTISPSAIPYSFCLQSFPASGSFPISHPFMGNICCCSVTQSCPFVTPWTAAHQASLSLTVSWSLPKFMSIAWVMPSSHLILWCPLLLLLLIFPNIRDFPWCLHQLTKILEFQLQHQSFQQVFRVEFKTDWFDLLAVQGALRSLLQHHSSEASDYILYTMVFLVVTYHCEGMENIVNSYVISLYGDIS